MPIVSEVRRGYRKMWHAECGWCGWVGRTRYTENAAVKDRDGHAPRHAHKLSREADLTKGNE